MYGDFWDGTYRVEAIVSEMFQVLAHPDLPHQLVLVAIHTSQLANMGKDILQSICQLQNTRKKPWGTKILL